jgi:hypothetical protein
MEGYKAVTRCSHFEMLSVFIPVKKTRPPMTQPATVSASHTSQLDGSADPRIRAFLTGESDGQDVLNALYGAVLDEPIPQRMRDLLKR